MTPESTPAKMACYCHRLQSADCSVSKFALDPLRRQYDFQFVEDVSGAQTSDFFRRVYHTDDFLAFTTGTQMVLTLMLAFLLFTDRSGDVSTGALGVMMVTINMVSLFVFTISCILLHPKIRKKLEARKSARGAPQASEVTGGDQNTISTKVSPIAVGSKSHDAEVLRKWGRT